METMIKAASANRFFTVILSALVAEKKRGTGYRSTKRRTDDGWVDGEKICLIFLLILLLDECGANAVLR
jgi:hypothetical protein